MGTGHTGAMRSTLIWHITFDQTFREKSLLVSGKISKNTKNFFFCPEVLKSLPGSWGLCPEIFRAENFLIFSVFFWGVNIFHFVPMYHRSLNAFVFETPSCHYFRYQIQHFTLLRETEHRSDAGTGAELGVPDEGEMLNLIAKREKIMTRWPF